MSTSGGYFKTLMAQVQEIREKKTSKKCWEKNGEELRRQEEERRLQLGFKNLAEFIFYSIGGGGKSSW